MAASVHSGPGRSVLLAHLSLVAVTLVWGTTFVIVKESLASVSPLLFNLLRMTLAFLALLLLNGRSLRGVSRRELQFSAGAGLLLGLGYQFQTAGLARTTPSKSAFLTGLVVVLVPLLSALPRVAPPDADRPGFAAFAGAALAFAGVILLTSQPGAGHALLAGLGVGEWLTLICALAFSAHLLTLGHAATNMSARRLGTLQIGFAVLTMLLTLPLGGRPVFHLNATVVLALTITSLLATAFAFTVQSWAQGLLPASHTALIFTLEPVFAWLTSILFLGEGLGRRALGGAALILCGILVAQLGPTSKLKPPLLHSVEG
jgi:drug/metabolite transporter (DMT)-like permease